MKSDRSNWKPLLNSMEEALDDYNAWSEKHLLDGDIRNKITSPLYHYTDGNGLKGILENEEIWFTSYEFLNDPKEISFGMAVAIKLLTEIGEGSDPRIKMFCDMVIDLFSHENMKTAFGIFIASFSRNSDDLGQWRGYGDDGRGYSLGLAPHLFHTTEGVKPNPTDNFVVVPVVYGEKDGRALHMPAIEKALRVAGKIIVHEADAMQDASVGMPFFDALAKTLIASELLLNCMMIKHDAYRNEGEVRLVMVGERRTLASHTSTRVRGGNIIPYIKSEFPIRADGSIAEVLVGPSAAIGAEDGVKALLPASSEVRIRRSAIPYRSG